MAWLLLEEKLAKNEPDEVKMNVFHNKKLRKNAQALRKGMTDEEKKLWFTFLKKLPVTVHRQKVIKQYIVDFYIAKVNLIIELDGSQHFEEDYLQKDKERDKNLSEWGFQILRYSNLEIHRNFAGVCEDIWRHIQI